MLMFRQNLKGIFTTVKHCEKCSVYNVQSLRYSIPELSRRGKSWHLGLLALKADFSKSSSLLPASHGEEE